MIVKLKPAQVRRDGGSRGAGGAPPPPERSRIPAAPMNGYLRIWRKRLGQFVLVVFIGINLAFVITHADADRSGRAVDLGRDLLRQHRPEAIEQMRQSLRELYGVEGTLASSTQLLDAASSGRFRAVAVGLPDAGLGA